MARPHNSITIITNLFLIVINFGHKIPRAIIKPRNISISNSNVYLLA
jgi:hypothetical protein